MWDMPRRVAKNLPRYLSRSGDCLGLYPGGTLLQLSWFPQDLPGVRSQVFNLAGEPRRNLSEMSSRCEQELCALLPAHRSEGQDEKPGPLLYGPLDELPHNGIFPFFGLHTVLWLYRSLREQARARGPQGGCGDGPDDYEEERENEGRAS